MSAGVRRAVTGLLVLLVLWVPALVAAAPASAHAVLVSATPGDGDLVAVPPEQVTMTFSESVEAGLAMVRLFDPYGEQVRTGRPANPEGRPDTLAVTMPAQTFMGTYTVSWRVLSGDSHPVPGAFTFHVGTPQTSGAPAPAQFEDEGSATVGVLYGGARLLAFAALALLIGLSFFLVVWWPSAGRYPATGRLIWGAWIVLVVTTVAVLLLFGPKATGRPLPAVADSALLSATLQTRVGVAMLGRLLVLSLVAPGLALLLTRPAPATARRRVRRIGGVLAAAVALAATWSIAGHSAVGRHTVVALPVDVVHLIAMGVWLGGLVALCGVLLRSGDVTAMRSAVPGFSRAAAICVGLLVITGSYQAWRQVGSPTALTTTSYGWLLLAKVLLVTVLVGTGAASRAWVRRHYRDAARTARAERRARRGPGKPELARFRRTVAVEAGLALVVLGLTAALVSSQPARTAQIEAATQQRAEQGWGPPAPAAAAPIPVTTRIGFDTGGPAGRGVLDLAVFPATVGSNELHLSVLDPAGGLMDIPEVTAALTLPDRALGPLSVPLQKLAPGHYIGASRIPLPGAWQLAVTVRTSELDQKTTTTPLQIR
ncbi:MAG: FixH family protein [Pseudonocardiaceae bacterium]